jgi:hypothetical protein
MISVPSRAAGEEPVGTGARREGPLSGTDTDGLRLWMETASSRIMFSMFASRDSK